MYKSFKQEKSEEACVVANNRDENQNMHCTTILKIRQST
jgi:hypothetical protein